MLKTIPDTEATKYIDNLGRGQLKEIYGATQAEAQASMNIFKHMDSQSKAILADCGARYGVQRGPWPHQAIACPAIRIGYEPSGDTVSDWDMKSNAETVRMIAEKGRDQWVQAPQNYRKSMTVETTYEAQLKCRAFQILRDWFLTKIPEHSRLVVLERITESFNKCFYDDALLDAARTKPVPLEIDLIDDFKTIIQQYAAETQNEALKKKQELANQLVTALDRV